MKDFWEENQSYKLQDQDQVMEDYGGRNKPFFLVLQEESIFSLFLREEGGRRSKEGGRKKEEEVRRREEEGREDGIQKSLRVL